MKWVGEHAEIGFGGCHATQGAEYSLYIWSIEKLEPLSTGRITQRLLIMSTATMKTIDFILPDLGEGVHEAEIISWKVKVGDTIDEMDVLAEMETDKALVEVPSPYAGKVVALHGKEGETAHVGQPIVTFENAMQGGELVHNDEHHAAVMTGSGEAAALAVEPAKPSSNDTSRSKDDDAGTVVGTMEAQPTLGNGSGKVMATPAVRRLAKELGVDLKSVGGSGRGGRITASDVQKAGGAAGSSSATSGDAARATKAIGASSNIPATAKPLAPIQVDASGTSKRIPFTGVRRKIAEALGRSVKTAVHFTVMNTADVTQLDRIRKQQSAATGEKISFLPFVVQAVCRALRKYPNMNANVDDAANEILVKGVINMGIAVDTEAGLMVAVIPNADQLPIVPLSREIASVAAQCRNRSVPLERLRGGTFTISNVGSYGGSFATPIINYPEVGILGVGRAQEAVMVRNGGIFIGKEMPLSVSCDHRVIDGVYGAMLLTEIVQLLETPEILLEPAG